VFGEKALVVVVVMLVAVVDAVVRQGENKLFNMMLFMVSVMQANVSSRLCRFMSTIALDR
jgi:hypothetical protein